VVVAAPFEDRIVHQALCAYIGPRLDRGLIRDSYACRTGLGTHAALRRATVWARHYRYALHLDVMKYFPSIDHALLLAQLRRDIPCEATLEVCRVLLEADARQVEPSRFYFPGDDLFTPFSRTMGLPIGNLTSQHFANRFLSPVDHRARDRLRIHPYLRYMDDMVLFDDDRERLLAWGHEIEAACTRQRLRLHPWQVVPTAGGVNFLGFRILPHELRIKRTSVRRAEVNLEERLAQARANPELYPAFLASMRSVFAHWKHGTSWRLRERTLRKLGIFWQDADELGPDVEPPPPSEP
jgi:hypothetical protein